MSLAEVQSRTAELDARLRQLSGLRAAAGLPTVVAGSGAAAAGTAASSGSSGSSGSPGASGGSGTGAFASQLAQALTPASASPRAAASPASSPASSAASSSSSSGTVTRSRDAQAPSSPTAGPRSAVTGEQVVALAKKHLGTPYEWGGESPGGFDCSGLIQWTYSKFGVDLPRVSTDQARAGRAVTPAQARPGDLVFFERGRVDHIGLYAGGGKWVVAPKTGDVVKVQDVDLKAATTIRRVLPDSAPRATTPSPASASTELPGLPAAGRRYADDILAAARKEGVDPKLLAAVAWSESGFRAGARSPAGAVGLMQLMPRTAAGLGVDPTDPVQALRGGARYLSQQLKAFGGREELALAAYNAGPGAVRKHGGIPPYAETQAYVKTVLNRYAALGGQA